MTTIDFTIYAASIAFLFICALAFVLLLRRMEDKHHIDQQLARNQHIQRVETLGAEQRQALFETVSAVAPALISAVQQTLANKQRRRAPAGLCLHELAFEDLDDPGARAAVLAVFALGTPKSGDATLDLGYYGVRVAIGQGLREAALSLANGTSRTLVGGVVTRALEPVVARFSSVVAQKAVAQSVPVFGALGGAVINTIFIEHYNGLARAHFTLRRLEREYGLDAVRGRFEAQANE